MDEKFMKLALLEAQKSKEIDEVPVGAIIVLNGEVISKNHNQSISQNNPTAHAEINALKKAAKKIGNYRLTGASMYVTLEPCAMCYGQLFMHVFQG